MSNLSNRRSFIGGSDARVIMGDSPSHLVRLWREKRGEIEPEDLTDNLMVQLGTVTEELNRRWYERNTGYAITDVQRQIQHPVIKWMAATLDGLIDPGGADRKSTRLNSSHTVSSYAVFCLKKKNERDTAAPRRESKRTRLARPSIAY